LLRPLADHLGALAICASDVLARLPWEALELDGVALIERSLTWSIPSATILARFGAHRRGNRPTRPFAGFAVPEAGGQAALPGAIREVRQAAEILGAGPSAVDENPTVASVRARAPGSRYLHFATHGLIRDDQPLYSGFPLTGNEFLHAYEMGGLDLDADLVVCSACETAKGEARAGEGTVGLAYALFEAGARAVLVSRWPVSDVLAPRQMRSLYRGLAAGRPPAQAVRDAALRARRNHRHPREWASFTLVDLGAAVA
jgi:CHAT domain-containing protein